MSFTSDKLYGRRGGRYVEAAPKAGVDALQRERVKAIETWPWGDPDDETGWGLSWWLARAARVDRRKVLADGVRVPLSPVDHRAMAVRDAYRRSKRGKADRTAGRGA